jgi:hypothetical protein
MRLGNISPRSTQIGSSPVRGARRSPRSAFVSVPHSAVDLGHARGGVLLAELPQDALRLLAEALRHEESRRAGDEERSQPPGGRRDCRHEQHPTPRVESQAEVLACAACDLGDQVVVEQSQEDAHDDRELLERAEAAAAVCRAISAMYVGTSTLARPTANPPTTSQAISIHNSPASPLPISLARTAPPRCAS